MGLTRFQVLAIELPLALPAIIAGSADRHRLDDRARDRRRVRDPGRSRSADLPRPPRLLQDGVHRRRRARGCARARRRRGCSSRCSALLTPWARGEEAGMSTLLLSDNFNPQLFVDAARFLADNQHLIWHKVVEHLDPVRRRAPRRARDRAADRRRPRPPPPWLVPRDQRLERRTGAADARGDRDRDRCLRDRLHQRDGRPRDPRDPADPDERLRRRRRGRPRRRRVGAGDGDDGDPDPLPRRAAARGRR